MQEESILFAEDIPASPSRPQELGKENKTRVTSGRRCGESFERCAPAGSFAKTFADMFASVSTTLPHSWKMTASPSGRLLFQLAPSAPRTEEKGSGLWQTPVADDAVERERGKWNSRGEPKLSAQVKLWPTPAARDFRSPNKLPYAQRGGGTKGEQLPNAVGGQLNPVWVEVLMGYPPGWTELGKPEFPALPLASPIGFSD
jgi:hypothetical protein